MSVYGRLFIEGACYHLNARGNQKQNVFRKNGDYQCYLGMLKHFKRKHLFRLYGYCLMPNHVHLMGEVVNKEKLSKFMQGITRSYAVYFNATYTKVGHLWQGRFKNKAIVKDQYLFNCINYIELNPVRAEIVTSPEAYPWSSYKERNLTVPKGEGMLDKLCL